MAKSMLAREWRLDEFPWRPTELPETNSIAWNPACSLGDDCPNETRLRVALTRGYPTEPLQVAGIVATQSGIPLN